MIRDAVMKNDSNEKTDKQTKTGTNQQNEPIKHCH